jgi:murein DD-endopeptidase MepM/ murein hydrolase activator NlpD
MPRIASAVTTTRTHWQGLIRLPFLLLLALIATGAGAAEPVIQVVSFGLREHAGEDVTGSGEQSPLFAASDAAGLPEELAVQLSELFAEEIDFHRDLNRGYVCTLAWEMYYPDGVPSPGRIVAARLVTPARLAEAFLFPLEPGSTTYFDARGLDIHKTPRLADPDREPWLKSVSGAALAAAFRRSPLEFSRITSHPARLRYHPILKQWRAHRGTDYGAPPGTRVRATADGRVTFVGTRAGYGRLVELRHFDRYTTRYGHLSAYAPGLAAGTEVGKGQVIGRVGMTGLATGPHLHYELHADPGASPAGRLVFAIRSVPPDRLAEFGAVMAEQRRRFAYANRASLIRLD